MKKAHRKPGFRYACKWMVWAHPQARPTLKCDLLDGGHDGGLGSGRRNRVNLGLLLLAAGKNGNSRKSKNGDGLHIYLTWYMVNVLRFGMNRRNGQIVLFFSPMASLK